TEFVNLQKSHAHKPRSLCGNNYNTATTLHKQHCNSNTTITNNTATAKPQQLRQKTHQSIKNNIPRRCFPSPLAGEGGVRGCRCILLP
ncbi:MAG: hypothetical protein LBU09_00065, partial [Endomicrobium sp.]|nr:hypothetical protein [Endomicrobium sp.]